MKNLEGIKKRRTVYHIGKNVRLSKNDLLTLIKENIKHTPSAFNSQSQRVVLLLDEAHEKLWKMVFEALEKLVPADAIGKTESKIDSFKQGFGTILFFDDETVTHGLMEKFPLYKENFMLWREQQNGMLQSNIWVSLAEENLGASLQHYSEVIESAVKEAFDLPKTWKMIAQMPFGSIETVPGPKEFSDVETRMMVIEK